MEEENNILEELQVEQNKLKGQNVQLSQALASSSFQGGVGNNLIEYQLESGELLSRLEHFLRGEYISVDEDGNESWTKQKNAKLILLNEYGISCIMTIIGSYIDKNTLLSTYDELRINEILADLGDELADWIYCNYEIIGMNTDFKKTRFKLLVLNILHTIETAYRRAIGGETREALNSAKIFTQSDFINNRSASNNPAMSKKKFNPFKPSSW